MSEPERLISELIHNAEASGNKVLERRLADLTAWYYNNRKTIDSGNLGVRQTFLEKAFWILLEVNALQLERIHELEGKHASEYLWTPTGLTVNGDMRT